MTIDPERWRTINRILDGALDLPPAERAPFLDSECAHDAALRREVEALIDSCERAGDLFEAGPALVAQEIFAESRDEWVRVAAGATIGHWRIVRELGRGGMGAVFLAERADGAFEKQAALKIVKRGMDTDEILRRFEHERQILARLEHPNIAGLFDGGATDDGQLPYFVMELAQGDPIDAYCDAARLTIRQRLEMLRTVCDAVQYAHRNLVVHRDLKPGNILVVDGQVKLLDFGIAKLLATESETAAGALTQAYSQRLTPQYAAPEQVLGQATTTATDVYALGVILYELLSGQAPYQIDGKSLHDVERVVCYELPRAPSSAVTRDAASAGDIARERGTDRDTLIRQLYGDLDAICLKALAKEPGARYDSAAALSADMQRHLSGIPILARPQTRRYRVQKFVQRNRRLVGLAAAVVAALVFGLVATLWQAGEAQRQRGLAELQAERASAARDYLINVFAELDPDRLQGRTEFTAEEVVQFGFDNLNSLEAQPAILASVMNALGQIVFNVGERERADSLFREAYAILSDDGDNPDLAISMMGIGEVWRLRFEYDSAQTWLRRAHELRRRLGDPRLAETEHALAFALYNIAASTPDSARRMDLLREAEQLNQDVMRLDRAAPQVRVRAMQSLGDLALETGRLDTAVARYRRALELGDRDLNRNHPDNARTRWGLADALRQRGDPAGAEKAYLEAIEIMTVVYGPRHQETAVAHYNFARFLDYTDRPADAAPHYRHAIRIAADAGQGTHPWSALAWLGLTNTAIARADRTEALHSFREAKRILRTATGGNEAFVCEYTQRYPGRLADLGATDEAISSLTLCYEAWKDSSAQARAAWQAADALTQLYNGLGRQDSVSIWENRRAAIDTLR
jgi:serine/threonine-protein kinase